MENFYHQIENIKSESKHKEAIYIIGKGKSISEIDKSILRDGIVINLNDSSKHYPGNISIINANWAWNANAPYSHQYYFSDKNPHDIQNCVVLPHKGNNYEEILNSGDISISDFLFVTAHQIAKALDDKVREVYFLGFDFHEEQKESNEASPHSHEFNQLFFKMQKSVFQHMMELSDLDIYHVGNLSFSNMSVAEFNSSDIDEQEDLYDNVIRKISNGETVIVAEFTNNHVGDNMRIKKMIQLAAEAGADMIKVQKRDVDAFYTQEQLKSKYKSPFGNTLEDYRRAVELTDSQFELIDAECRKHGIPWFASILDYNSFKYILRYNPRIIKLPSTISNHKNYLMKVAEEFKGDIVVSTGFTDPHTR